jgi:tryptophan synthase alpha chain
MNAIDALFGELRGRNAKAFMPFVTAGDPDLATSARIVHEVVRRGAHLVEIGFPYSDPIADGSVIQASYTRALAGGVHIDDVFSMVRSLGGQSAPLVGMVSYSLVYHRGPARFLADADAAGLSGLIVPDLPVEEAKELADLAAERDFKLIQLVTPTTPRSRASEIVRRSTGFVYVVSVAGITGMRDQLPPELLHQLRWLRSQTSLPLCVGFGINKPEQVRMLREAVDGVIVGSALVRQLENARITPIAELLSGIGELTHTLAMALSGEPSK